jgi:hypothetical protein
MVKTCSATIRSEARGGFSFLNNLRRAPHSLLHRGIPIGWDIAGPTYRKEQESVSDSVAILGAKL